MQTVLFYRHLRKFTGGHLKMKNYFDHVGSFEGFRPTVYFSKTTVWEHTNPWHDDPDGCVDRWLPEQADVVVLGGADWEMIPAEKRRNFSVPIVNIIQGLRHADPKLPHYDYLENRAIRICVSSEVKEAIMATGRVNGPVFTIPNGIDIDTFPEPLAPPLRRSQVLIAGSKQPRLAKKIDRALKRKRIPVEILVKQVSRGEFLERVRNSKITLFLPQAQEGFYLPALEGMVLGTLVICPDCGGNRSFCIAGHNCFRPEYREKQIVQSVTEVWQLSPSDTECLLQRARDTAHAHSLEREREAFHEILQRVPELWAEKS